MSWAGKRVLVTGGTGFIGSHLVEYLMSRGARVKTLQHYNSFGRRGWMDFIPRITRCVQVVQGDLTDFDSVDAAVEGCEIVFHLGALIGIPYSYVAPRSYVDVIMGGTVNVLQAARRRNVARVVNMSTSEVYGTAQRVPIDEKHPLQGQSPYAACKIGAEKMCEAFHLSFDTPVASARCFNTYGPRQSMRVVLPTIIAQCLWRDEIRIGNLTPRRDLNYVTDVAAGLAAIAECDDAVGKALNVASDRSVSVEEMIKIVKGVVDRDVPVVVDPARVRKKGTEVEVLQGDSRLMRGLTGWKPEISLSVGVRKIVEWMREHPEFYRSEEYAI